MTLFQASIIQILVEKAIGYGLEPETAEKLSFNELVKFIESKKKSPK
jgi:hypothetical protein